MAEISKAEEEMILGGDDSLTTRWKLHKRIIEQRPKGWLRRFAHKVEDAELYEHPKSYDDARYDRMKAAGWEPVTKRLPTEPTRFSDDKIAAIRNWSDTSLETTNLCYLCWAIVPIGPVRVHCLKCPIVAHNACVLDVRKYRLPVIASNRVNSDVQRQLATNRIEKDKNGVVSNWICPFCIQEVNHR
jgi:hypothetical protein